VVSSVTMEVELAGERDAWQALLDARTGHPLVSEIITAALGNDAVRPSVRPSVCLSHRGEERGERRSDGAGTGRGTT